jgi:hypothetical protein
MEQGLRKKKYSRVAIICDTDLVEEVMDLPVMRD